MTSMARANNEKRRVKGDKAREMAKPESWVKN